MKCPKCKKGYIRVVNNIGCQHTHPLFCETCFTGFRAICTVLELALDNHLPEYWVEEYEELTEKLSKKSDEEKLATKCLYPSLEEFRDRFID